MSMFPAPSPLSFKRRETRCRVFEQQERSFFAQGGAAQKPARSANMIEPAPHYRDCAEQTLSSEEPANGKCSSVLHDTGFHRQRLNNSQL